MRHPRLIIADLDGSLLNRDEQVSPGTAAALDRLAANGVGFTVATGRAAGKLHITGATKWALLPWICATGAMTVRITGDTVERLSAVVLDSDTIAAVIAAARSRCPDAIFGADRHDLLITGPGYPPSPAWVHRRDLAEGEDFADEPVDQLRIWAADAQALTEVDIPGVVWRDIGRPGYIDVVAAGTSKSAAAAKLCAELGIDAEDVWAVGDGPGDIDLLEWAGRGVAMLGSHSAVLAAADDVTEHGHDDDGVARYLAAHLGWLIEGDVAGTADLHDRARHRAADVVDDVAASAARLSADGAVGTAADGQVVQPQLLTGLQGVGLVAVNGHRAAGDVDRTAVDLHVHVVSPRVVSGLYRPRRAHSWRT